MATALPMVRSGPTAGRLPEWIRARPPSGPQYQSVRGLLREFQLETVCVEARCPNLSECWSAGAATLMLLGSDCTRRCTFCAVQTRSPHGVVDASEPDRVADAVARWGLRYIVLTQVCRDDLADGGASILAATVSSLRARTPGTLVELLIGDLGGRSESLDTVVHARPDVLAHNIETVPRLSPLVRDRRASFTRSLTVLKEAHQRSDPPLVTKSSVMVGLGETDEELTDTFEALRSAGVELLTLGQYLRPTPAHHEVARYVPPDEFGRLRDLARSAGFAGVEAGPMVRSSYHAEQLYRAAIDRRGG